MKLARLRRLRSLAVQAFAPPGIGPSGRRRRVARLGCGLATAVGACALAGWLVAGLGVASSSPADREERRGEDRSLEDPHVREVLDRWARDNAARRKDHPPFDKLPDLERDAREQRERRAEREAQRRSPEEREARKRSRRAFKQLDKAAKVELARDRFPDLFSKPDRRLLPLEEGERVVRYTGETTALVDSSDGAPSIVEGTQPLRARDEDGDLAPVDFNLEQTAQGWEPANASVAVEFGERANQAFSFPGGFTVGIPGADSPGTRTSNEIFFADVASDTDAWFGPSPTGVRFAFQLRSEDSPEQLRLAVSDAPGVELRVSPDAKGVALFKGGERLGVMSAPLAFDADKEQIDVRLRVEGREIVIEVPHRSSDARYPAVVDPVYENQDSWKYGNGNVAGWSYYEQVPQFPHAFGDACCGVGFYLWRNPNQWFNYGTFAEYRYFAPTVWSYIHRADFLNVRHAAYATNTTQGMWSSNWYRHQHQYTFGYSFDNANNYYSVCADGQATDWACDEYVNFDQSRGNYVQSSLWANQTGAQPQWAWNYFGGARIWMSDPEPPTPLYFEDMPSGWVRDVPARGYSYGANEAHVRWGDRGLGMWGLWMDVPGMGRQYSADWGGCSGAQSSRCPESRAHTFSLAGINEGIQTVTTGGQDVLGRTATASKTVKIDRSGPQLSLSGAFWDARNTTLSQGEYNLHVEANDGSSGAPRSGANKIQLRIDGDVYREVAQPCGPVGNCSLSADWTLRPEDLEHGSHSIQVVSYDEVGNSSQQTFTLNVDHGEPLGPIIYDEELGDEYGDEGSPNPGEETYDPGQGDSPDVGEAPPTASSALQCQTGDTMYEETLDYQESSNLVSQSVTDAIVGVLNLPDMPTMSLSSFVERAPLGGLPQSKLYVQLTDSRPTSALVLLEKSAGHWAVTTWAACGEDIQEGG